MAIFDAEAEKQYLKEAEAIGAFVELRVREIKQGGEWASKKGLNAIRHAWRKTVAKMVERLGDPDSPLGIVYDAFREEKDPNTGKKWRKLAPVTEERRLGAAAIARENAFSIPGLDAPNARGGYFPILRHSGALLSDIIQESIGKAKVMAPSEGSTKLTAFVFGTRLKYAYLHQYGGRVAPKRQIHEENRNERFARQVSGLTSKQLHRGKRGKQFIEQYSAQEYRSRNGEESEREFDKLAYTTFRGAEEKQQRKIPTPKARNSKEAKRKLNAQYRERKKEYLESLDPNDFETPEARAKAAKDWLKETRNAEQGTRIPARPFFPTPETLRNKGVIRWMQRTFHEELDAIAKERGLK